VSAISPDGRWRWDGGRWVVNEVGSRPLGAVRYELTEDTRRVQIAATVYLALSAAYTISVVPLTMQASMQSALRTSPNVDPATSAQFSQVFSGMMTGITIATVVISVAWAAVLIYGTWSQWRWVYYVLMIFGALSAVSIVTNVVGLAGVGRTAVLPAWAHVFGIVFALLYLSLAVWMFVLWRRHHQSAWARRAVPL